MSTPPEVLFDRYFHAQTPSMQQIYQGKDDLECLEIPGLKEILLRLQQGLNFALANEREVPEHRSHPPFHFDYIRSSLSNAIAFRHDGYSFIGVTIPLIETLMTLCGRLSRSIDLLSLLGLDAAEDISDGLGLVLFHIAIFFIVSHEYTHIVHGHSVMGFEGSTLRHEIHDDGYAGGLSEQALEADADSYAIYHIMGNWIAGVERSEGLTVLNRNTISLADQDDLLFSLVVVAIGAYFMLRPVPQLDAESVYKLSHPPQAARLNSLMDTAIAWCRQNRGDLAQRMTEQWFNRLLSHVASAIWEANDSRHQNWMQQVDFLRSADGAEYLGKLRTDRDQYRASL
ncbi:hypothetical protein [Acidicapsa ligni]|uniref:hypothetical protein n=1 Tax=Acidicapsa ligni TaxID=542300 RepID=UPI0021DF8649|nr:hypothetical protein [Acidicapsa ligni]